MTQLTGEEDFGFRRMLRGDVKVHYTWADATKGKHVDIVADWCASIAVETKLIHEEDCADDEVVARSKEIAEKKFVVGFECASGVEKLNSAQILLVFKLDDGTPFYIAMELLPDALLPK